MIFMRVQKKTPVKSPILKSSHRHITVSNPHLPTKTQTDLVFDIVKRSVLKKAKKEGRNISALELRHEISELMQKWPKQNWPKLKEMVSKK